MGQFLTAGHLVPQARISPRTVQSGQHVLSSGKAGEANRYLRGVLGEVAAGAARSGTFLGERYRRLVRRRNKQRALRRLPLDLGDRMAPSGCARFADLGPDYYDKRIDKDRKIRLLVRQLNALGHEVTLNTAA